ncbi:MAG: hypothetical protein WDN76_02040 [Alphaproteobacteria bacterium]
METWESFFLGELGAAAAFAGLIFVSLSVNQARILAFANIPERGVQALITLFQVFVVAAIMLIPQQPQWLTGVQLLLAALVHLLVMTRSHRAELRNVAPEHRRHSWLATGLGQGAAWMFVVAAVLVMVRADWIGFYVLAPATLLSFFIAGLNAWVLLIEINR